MDAHTLNILQQRNACSPALTWLAEQPSRRAAWAACDHGDWMVWVLAQCAGRRLPARRKLTMALCVAIKPMIWPYHERGSAPRKAFRFVERWAQGRNSVTMDECQAVRDTIYLNDFGVKVREFCSGNAVANLVDATRCIAVGSEPCDAICSANNRLWAAAFWACRYDGDKARLAAVVRRYYPNPPRAPGD